MTRIKSAPRSIVEAPAPVREAAESLAAALQSPVTIWRKASSEGAWAPLDGDSEGDESTQADLTTAVETGQTVVRNHPVGKDGPDLREVRVALPSDRLTGQYAATAACGPPGDRMLAQIADGALACRRSTEAISELQEENDSFTAQLTSDLEELSFLRSMVAQVRQVAAADELSRVAEQTLPILNETIRASTLVYYRTPDHERPLEAQIGLQFGPSQQSEETLLQIVKQLGNEAIQRTLVRNWHAHQMPDCAAQGERIEGVRSVVLAPLASGDTIFGWLAAVNRQELTHHTPESPWQLADDEFGSGEGTLLATTASVLATHAANLDMLREKEQILVSVVRSLVSAIEAKDPYTCGHSERVALFGRRIGEQVGYTEDEAEKLYLTGLLHDVGKIGVSDATLLKAGKLTDEEFAEVTRHPDEGWAILCDLEQLRYVLPGVLYHHERWDGRGYPDGLAGEKIPLDGRVLAVADAFDAMTSDRPYRNGMPNEKAESILREGAGTQWDERCVEAFFEAREDILQIQADYQQRPRRQRQPNSHE